MLAGLLIAIVVVVGLAVGLPWVLSSRDTDQELEGDPTERFSDSVRILHRDVVDAVAEEDAARVSTPLTRRADLLELRMVARQAARRRLVVLAVLALAVVTLTVLGALSITPWWPVAIPAGLIVAFLGVARFSVVAMHRDLDQRAAALKAGFDEDEDTATIDLTERENTESVEISIDLSMPTTMGALWDPIPVVPATYVQQPLLPRTVRTIDLSAPVSATSPFVPTADNPTHDAVADEATGPMETGRVAEFRPRAVGE